MAKKGKTEKDRAIALSQEGGAVHKPRKERHHIALERAELGQRDEAENLTVGLLPWARNSAMGRTDGLYQYPGMGRDGYFPTRKRPGAFE